MAGDVTMQDAAGDRKTTSWPLFWTGMVTMLPGLQFVFPLWILNRLGLDVADPAGMFYARHWGLMALCMGALVVYVSRHHALRGPVLLAAAAEKLGLALLIGLSWNEPALQGMRGAAIFDGFCTVLYVWMLLRAARAVK